MGIGSYLQGLAQALKGNAPQAATPAAGATPADATAGAAAPADPSTTGAQFGNIPIQSSFLDNPLLQGALATYFGAISSPRSQGLGGAIGHGGLAGLGAYEAASKAEYEPYLLGAQIAHTQAQTKQAEATTGYTKARTEQIGQERIANKAFADKLRLQANAPGVDPQTKQTWLTMADGIEQSPKWVNPTDALTKPAQTIRDLAAAGESRERTSEMQQKLPGELAKTTAQTAHEQAETLRAQADATLDVDKKRELNARADELEQEVQAGGVKPKMETITGPGGETKEVVVTPGYDPSVSEGPGWRIGKAVKPPTPEGAANLKEVSEAYTKRYGAMARTNIPVVGGIIGAGTAPSFEDFAKTMGVDPTTGLRLSQKAPTTPTTPSKAAGARGTPKVMETAPPAGATYQGPTVQGPDGKKYAGYSDGHFHPVP